MKNILPLLALLYAACQSDSTDNSKPLDAFKELGSQRKDIVSLPDDELPSLDQSFSQIEDLSLPLDSLDDLEQSPDVVFDLSLERLDQGEEVDRAIPLETYPEPPYGTERGRVIEDLLFESPEGPWRLSDVRNEARLLLIITSSGHCPSCREEQDEIQEIADQHRGEGLLPIVILLEDADYEVADAAYVEEWRQRYELSIPVLADPVPVLDPYFQPVGRRMVLMIDTLGMKILEKSRSFHSIRTLAEALEHLERLNAE